jgi:iron complex transport system ATP-binding protein
VLFDGRRLAEMPRRDVAQRVAYVPQSTQMIFPFAVIDVVLTGRSPYGSGYGFESAEDRDKARQALSSVGAEHLENRRFTELSGGERQLVAFARALAQEPECLLLDEPSAALDLKHRAEMIRMLRQLRDEKGLTALLVTHDLQLLDPGFDRLFAMRRGAVLAQGPAAEILSDRILAEVYEDPTVHAIRHGGRTFVWSEC